MNEAPTYLRRRPHGEAPSDAHADLYAALDLGTNNCRLMIASLSHSRFRIVEAYSRIVRLGEGLSHSGQLHDHAMERALRVLKVCADKIRKHGVVRIRAVATQACRVAANGRDFVHRVERETGLRLSIITPEEEAHLSVMGCASLLQAGIDDRAALVIDVGGGSTELSWVELSPTSATQALPANDSRVNPLRSVPRPRHWISLPVGVVSLAERFPESADRDPQTWFEDMVEDVSCHIRGFTAPEPLRPHFDAGRAFIIGTSGAITSLAGVHLGLEKYDRSRVDGLWMTPAQCRGVIDRLLELGRQGREREPCIGIDRADLVLAGAAILEAVQRLWPCERLRVADRGLREGLLLSMAMRKPRRRRRSSGKRKGAGAKVPAG